MSAKAPKESIECLMQLLCSRDLSFDRVIETVVVNYFISCKLCSSHVASPQLIWSTGACHTVRDRSQHYTYIMHIRIVLAAIAYFVTSPCDLVRN